jgi:outer membrane protein TolC
MALFVTVSTWPANATGDHARDRTELAIRNQPTIRRRGNVNAGQDVTQAMSPYLPQVSASTGYAENRSLEAPLGDTISKAIQPRCR